MVKCTDDEIRELYARVLDRMRTLCARREYCSGDIYRKAVTALEKCQDRIPDIQSGQLAASIVSSLVSDKYLDDGRYAAAFARDKSSISGWGPMKIRNALAAKGLGKEVIDRAMSMTDSGASRARMEKVLEVKFRSMSRSGGQTPYMLKMKMLRFAVGRGYGYEEAAPVIERLVSGVREDM